MSSPSKVVPIATRHPIEDPEIQAKVKAWTQAVLELGGGTGEVSVTFNFFRNKVTDYSIGGRRKDRT